jgi:hypothetical protein
MQTIMAAFSPIQTLPSFQKLKKKIYSLSNAKRRFLVTFSHPLFFLLCEKSNCAYREVNKNLLHGAKHFTRSQQSFNCSRNSPPNEVEDLLPYSQEPPLVAIMSQMNPVYSLPPYLFNTRFNIILSPTRIYFMLPVSLRFSSQTPLKRILATVRANCPTASFSS